jgi:hypothetical protein
MLRINKVIDILNLGAKDLYDRYGQEYTVFEVHDVGKLRDDELGTLARSHFEPFTQLYEVTFITHRNVASTVVAKYVFGDSEKVVVVLSNKRATIVHTVRNEST